MLSQSEGDVGRVGHGGEVRVVEQGRYLLPADDELWSFSSRVSEMRSHVLQSVHCDESASFFIAVV